VEDRQSTEKILKLNFKKEDKKAIFFFIRDSKNILGFSMLKPVAVQYLGERYNILGLGRLLVLKKRKGYGKTLGIVGCGSIGKTVERLAIALGMKVVGVDMCVYGRLVTLEEMLPVADFITIHVPLTPHTKHMISKKRV
jgi:lactate dehydrogenase-like 2-hydroxyacid dehydrogenase